jgi:hypothetical protein
MEETTMANDIPLTCSLGASDLERQLAEIAAVGKKSLVSHESDGDRHLLRFRADPDTRRRLETIVVAEAKCCGFLDLSLREDGSELILSISTHQDATALADGLADAFSVS